MKNNYNKKQKIIIIGICIILIGVIIYYMNSKKEETNLTELIPYEENVLQGNSAKEESSQETTNDVTIHITGAVNKPGVYTFTQGSRIADAVDKAQGLREDADAEGINLAYVMEDGMQIIIPSKQSNKDTGVGQEMYITTDSSSSNQNIKGNSEKSSEGKVNINTATEEQLETLTGIGPSTAKKIIQYRKEHGNFKSIEDIKSVSGIGDSKYNSIKDRICVK